MERSVGEHATESTQPCRKGAIRGNITALEAAYEECESSVHDVVNQHIDLRRSAYGRNIADEVSVSMLRSYNMADTGKVLNPEDDCCNRTRVEARD